MSQPYTTEFIYPLVEKVLHCTMCTHAPDSDAINTRVMLFACDADLGRVYMLTHNATSKIAELRANPSATACVLSTAEVLDNSSETIFQGTVRLKVEIDDPEVQGGLRALARKSGIVQALLDGGSLGEYVLLVLDTSEVIFRVYKDVLANADKTRIRPVR